jgi:hypothetical protein
VSTARSLLFKYVRTSKRVSVALSDPLGSQFGCALPWIAAASYSPSGAGLRLPECSLAMSSQVTTELMLQEVTFLDLHSTDILCTSLLFYSEPECLHVKCF